MPRAAATAVAPVAPVVPVLVALAGCAAGPAGEVRYHNQPIVWRVNDRAPLARPPAEREYNRTLYHTDGFFVRRITRALDVKAPGRALDVNALDEVPDSTWFTNRIGVRDLSLDELRRGPNVDPSPFEHRPWTITGAKTGGTAIGFTFKDARGGRYILKFDPKDAPEMETAAHAIGHRIVWASGYNVPQDHIGYLRREDLVVAPDATAKDPLGNKQPLRVEDVERALARVYRAPDGRYRVLASRFLPGKPVGPFAREGRRPDDPNDTIPHERRRVLRGQAAIFSWLNHTDIQEDQSLDVFVEPGFVQHYILDFGKALGVMGYVNDWQTVGYTYRLDLGMGLRALLTLGLWKRPWEDVAAPKLRGIGLFEADHYHPGQWRTNSQYWPFEDHDRFDAFWGSKILMRFTREQLAAIVAEGQYSDPRAAAYMLETLIRRQRATARHWFAQVSPLDRFTLEPGALCFDDLARAYGLDASPARYHAEAYDHGGRPLGARRTLPAAAASAARLCAPLPLSPAPDAYTIVRLQVQRNARLLPPVLVHVARRDGALHVIGIRRE